MIFTIGYQALTPERLDEIVRKLDALLIDVRSMPRSRKAGFSKNRLSSRLGAEHYVHLGASLGGRPPGVTPAGIDAVRSLAADRDVILMCQEAAPGDCHRHHTICGPHFPNAIHVFEDTLLRAADLSEALLTDEGDYLVLGSLADLLRHPKKIRKLLA